jgi:hypothetical protein
VPSPIGHGEGDENIYNWRRILMKLLCVSSFDEEDEGYIDGYVETEDAYYSFSIKKNEEPVIHAKFPKKDYRGYRHFAGVIGKFDEWAFLLKNPIPIPKLDFDLISSIYKATPDLQLKQ